MATYFRAPTFLFWQRWLFYSSLLFALAGIIFALFGKSILFVPYDKMLAQVFWQSAEFPPKADLFRAFIYKPLGGTILSDAGVPSTCIILPPLARTCSSSHISSPSLKKDNPKIL